MKNSYILILFLLSSGACNKYLDVKPKGIIIPSKVSEYAQILNSPTLTQTFAPDLLYCTDDYFNVFPSAGINSTVANTFYWREYINPDDQASPDVWGPLYHSIYDANIIVNGIMEASGDSLATKNELLGEALVMRADCYLDLLTVFAKAYNPQTAATDPGLPLVTSLDVTDKTPPRSSVQVTLDTLINNVQQSIGYLPATNINRYRVTVYVAYGLLSRIYLYMADYAQALKYAQLASGATHALLNYNNYTGTGKTDGFPVSDQNPEILWQRASADYTIPTFLLYSPDLRLYFDSATDLRFTYLTVRNNNGLGRSAPNGRANFGITFPELDLTRAEVLARTGDVTGALTIVNNLRKNRIVTAHYADLSAGTGEEALSVVLAERRRELAFGGLRWFDMKRLDREGRMPVVRRIDPVTQHVDDSLPPQSPKYTFQIPARVLEFNPGMQTNLR